MAFTVVAEASNVGLDKGVVVIETDHIDGNFAFEELRGQPCRHEAIVYAAKQGMPDPRLNGNPEIYAIDPEGNLLEDQTKQKFWRYRANIPLQRKML